MGLGATLVVFVLARRLQARVGSPLVNPVLVSMLVLVAALLLLRVPYASYAASADWLTRLLEPTVVALAVPLYRQWPVLRKGAKRIVRACLVGSLVAMTSSLALSLLLGASRQMALSLLPRQVTTPIAMAISTTIGGNAPLTVVSVIVAGVVGAALGPSLLGRLGVVRPAARGLAMGAAAHALGTARMGEESDTAQAHGTVALALCGLATAVAAPIVAKVVMWWWP